MYDEHYNLLDSVSGGSLEPDEIDWLSIYFEMDEPGYQKLTFTVEGESTDNRVEKEVFWTHINSDVKKIIEETDKICGIKIEEGYMDSFLQDDFAGIKLESDEIKFYEGHRRKYRFDLDDISDILIDKGAKSKQAKKVEDIMKQLHDKIRDHYSAFLFDGDLDLKIAYKKFKLDGNLEMILKEKMMSQSRLVPYAKSTIKSSVDEDIDFKKINTVLKCALAAAVLTWLIMWLMGTVSIPIALIGSVLSGLIYFGEKILAAF